VDDGIYIDDIQVIRSMTALTVLPVHFTSFTGTLLNEKLVQLHWEAVIDEEHDFFIVEHSTDGINFSNMAQGTFAGSYTYDDHHPSPGNNYYRIRQVNKNGSFTFSAVIQVVVNASVSIELFPNPIKDVVHIRLSNKNNQPLNIEIFDVQGRTIYKKSSQVAQNAVLDVNMKEFPSQVYLLHVTNTNGEILASEKIIRR
jgi:hypothetical protein